MRPLASAQDASPATLRLGIRSVKDGISVELIKRKGPAPAEPLWIPMLPSPILLSPHQRVREQVDVAPATPEELAREASCSDVFRVLVSGLHAVRVIETLALTEKWDQMYPRSRAHADINFPEAHFPRLLDVTAAVGRV